jgi:citrate lyase subunit beta / citryl-CoA lyase
MRSLLFVPGDSPKKLDKCLTLGADTLLLDLEDAVAPSAKAGARATVRDFLKNASKEKKRPLLYVRINSLDTGLVDGDLDTVLEGAPDGILLPKSNGHEDLVLLDAKITAREAVVGIPDGATKIMVLVTETPVSVFTLGTYKGASARLTGLSWAALDLAVAVNAETYRLESGAYTQPYQVARALGLFAAHAADVLAIDTPYTNFKDEAGLRREAEEARRDGFHGKMAIHPAQVAIINEVFTPTAEQIKRARAIVDAFKANPGAGTLGVNGEMLDRPHLIRAERLLAQAKAAGAL